MVVSALVALVVPAVTAAVPPPAYTGRLWSPFPLRAPKLVPGTSLPSSSAAAVAAREAAVARAALARQPDARRAVMYRAPRGQAWPAAGTANVVLREPVAAASKRGEPARTAPRPRWQRAGALPIYLAAVRGRRAPASVQVRVASRAVTAAAGIRGVLFTVTAAPGNAAGRVRISLAYSRFADLYGGDWASRLRLVRLPLCALSTPGRPGCRAQKPLRDANESRQRSINTVADLPGTSQVGAEAPGAQAGSTLVLALDAGPSGSDGDYTATPLQPSGTWTAQQGDFTYSYPISVPAPLGGTAPQVALSYDSQSIDSETSASNTQAGWIGDGWDYAPGFIERSYEPCSRGGIANSGDECWGGWNATMSLGGQSYVLVRDDSGTWKLQSDDGTQVQLLHNAPNGLWNGEYWLITTPDGTKYYFGLNHLPGGDGSDPASNAAWGVPVYCPGSTDPCNSASAPEQFLGWRWNLDYVVDPLGNLTTYNYQQETNYYSMGGGQNANGTLTQYVRGGTLQTISYGWLVADARVNGTMSADQIAFTSSPRCTGTATDCSSFSKTSVWPDTPADQICKSSGTCTNNSPTFFSTNMLTQIDTEVLEGSGASPGYKKVDTYQLTQKFPAAGTSGPVIFLNSIQRTGDDGGSAQLQPMTFNPVEVPNRVAGGDPSPVYRPRVDAILTGTGAEITITYAQPQCSRLSGGNMPASPQTNTLACFPVYWSPAGGSGQIQDWFNKTLVSEVDTSDQTQTPEPSPDQVTSYSYSGGAAWHYNDSPVIRSSNRTWDQYRGFGQVIVNTGVAPDPVTKTGYIYFQGMDGDNNGSGGTKSASVQDTNSDSYVDRNWLAGSVLETDTYTQAGSSTITSKVINAAAGSEWQYTQTASQTEPGSLPPLLAEMLNQAQTRTQQALAAGGYRTSKTTRYFSNQAQLTQTDSAPFGSAETCTTTSYATPPNGNTMMESYPDEVTVVTGSYTGTACPAKTSADIVSDLQYYYDDPTSTLTSMGTLGSLGSPGGLVTGTAELATWPSGWQPKTVTAYDGYGRVIAATDAGGNTTTTAYRSSNATPGNTTELPTSITAINPAPFNWTTTTMFDQSREEPTSLTDVNGEQTTETYDPLGRLSTVTTPIDQGSGSGQATYKFAYNIDGTSPPSVTTQTLQETGGYSTDVKIYDGMLQLRQEQSEPYSSSSTVLRLISDDFYDSHGWVIKKSGPYTAGGSGPTTDFFLADDGSVPNQTVTVYDGEGRPTDSQFYSAGNEQWHTATSYPGLDETDTTPPTGATRTSVFTDALGQTTASWDYTTSTITGVASEADKTTYTYTPAGQTATVADNNGNTWTYGYNLLGQEISSTDPAALGSDGPSGQAGTTTYAYDPNGSLTSTTKPSGQEISYTYDALGRKMAEYNGSTSGTQIAAWTYDASALPGSPTGKARGELSSSTATPSGSSGPAYTELVKDYNSDYEATDRTESLPASALAPGSSGTSTYEDTSTYTTLTGEPASTTYQADNGLPPETVSYSFDAMGQEIQIGGIATYLASLEYDAWGNPYHVTMGPFPNQLLQIYDRDPATQRVLDTHTDFETLKYEPDATTYAYNKAGDLTAISDLERTSTSASVTQTQCFSYGGGTGDLPSQLTAAWTDTGGIQTSTSPTVLGLGGCVNSSPAAANIGGVQPYWETWTNDLAGDRTSQTTYNTSLSAAQDTPANATVAQTTYPGGDLSNSPSSNATSAPQSQPDAAQAVTTTNPSGTSVLTASYNGNGATVAERGSGPGPLISAIMNAAKFCADDFGGATTNGTKVDLGSCSGGSSQSWSVGFGSGGNIKIGGGSHCLTVQGNGTTAGTLVEINGCTAADAAGQKWVAGPNGSLVNPNSGMCLDDPNGVKTVGTQLDIAVCDGMPRQGWSSEPITYTPDGHVATVTNPSGTGTQTASYGYDADGNLVAQGAPSSDTIYLFGGAEQITYVPGSPQTIIAQRFYTAPDGTTAVRTVTTTGTGANAKSTSAVNYEVANAQGTAVQSWTTGGAVAYRYYDPYGQQVGPPPGWPDNHDFLGRPQDAVTGYDLLGARQYNPATGAFLSLDPVFQPGDPLAMGGYAYADDEPTNAEDPTGQCPCLTDGSTDKKNPNTGTYGGGSGGVTDPAPVTGGDPFVPVSPHVSVERNDPRLVELQKAWNWETSVYGPAKGSGNELEAWVRACSISPYAGICSGQFAAQLTRGMTPNFAIGEAFSSGDKLVLGAGASIAGFLVPNGGSGGTGPVKPYDVGPYKDLQARSPSGDGIDLHHVPQGGPARQVIPGYEYANAPTIALPEDEHAPIPNLKGTYSGTAQELIERDFENLRTFTNAPEDALQALADLIQSMYPGVFGESGPEMEGGAGGE
jgi:RHS repeat-associated protein